MPPPTRPPRRAVGARQRRRWWSWGAVGMLCLIALIAAGIALYFDERDARERALVVGSRAADRIEVAAEVRRTDPGERVARIQLTVSATGRFADAQGLPKKDVVLVTNAPGQEEVTFKQSSVTLLREVAVPLTAGALSDYPFDRYTAVLGLTATLGGDARTAVPLRLTVRDTDPNFSLDTRAKRYEAGVALIDTQMRRSRSTFIMAWFIITAMWAIALSVLLASQLVVRQRRGLVWPALGWMAATLFALVGLRSAAPGSPPNGSVLDYAAFYWAEALIALSLTRLVFHGIHIEHHTGGPVSPQPVPVRPQVRRRRGVPAGARARLRRGGGRDGGVYP
ncbi:DUF4436 domain-containing protein [Streptomyces sp. SID5785]|uniref:DUF4436 family protein n=1 Tax=Streptomyces sp. SID5785 TaxID=2690309 RepID=UPI001360D34E|nr:DUF4436 family protein [Streptomyces sp. SID5785]MZD04683.1 DUF4436 domain-containing protein [Streptomyces sp. SID5785]MZD08448.1 DUF4436 domain-containing protein [Streptomyces sp. SID5785]